MLLPGSRKSLTKQVKKYTLKFQIMHYWTFLVKSFDVFEKAIDLNKFISDIRAQSNIFLLKKWLKFCN